ncbi:NfeD family protein [Streptacidiphilus carbonis]|jgi:membrane protein implicated in regulation of membrane protease activity|uniref:NfeD family protein n=1 Tax=Streptacidiphilus carbonis TaxID=105422 RepID=UPI0005A77B3B|nr:NfeD family protein [Streptacidiphilus carbonis]
MWWLIVAAALGVPLVVTAMPEFGMFAIGAGAAALTSALGAGTVAQFVVFLAVSVLLVVFVRPVAMRSLRSRPRVRMGIEALTGATALVLEEVDEHGGRIKLQGEVWSARALDPHQVFAPGQQVSVAQIDGATALVL